MADDRTRIKLGGTSRDNRVDAFIKHLYGTFPRNPINPDQFAMLFGDGEDQKIAVFDVRPGVGKGPTAQVYWVHTYPHRQGVGTMAFDQLKEIAREFGVGLELMPWKHGPVSQRNLIRFYRKQGFKGQNRMTWNPGDGVEESGRVDIAKDFDPSDEFYDPDERYKPSRLPGKRRDPQASDESERGIGVWVPSWDAFFYISAHILRRSMERGTRPDYVTAEIARLFDKHRQRIEKLPARTHFVLRTPQRYSIVMNKTTMPDGRTRYAAVTVLPNGVPIPPKARYVFAEDSRGT